MATPAAYLPSREYPMHTGSLAVKRRWKVPSWQKTRAEDFLPTKPYLQQMGFRDIEAVDHQSLMVTPPDGWTRNPDADHCCSVVRNQRGVQYRTTVTLTTFYLILEEES